MRIADSLLSQLMLKLNYQLADLFFIVNDMDVASLGDDNATYSIADNIDDLIKSLEEGFTAWFQCFHNNLLKSNPEN